MEAAGLFAAAETRRYSAAATFVVADLLADTGWSGVAVNKVRAQLAAIAEAAIKTLHERTTAR